MRSNLVELFNEIFPKYEVLEQFEIKDLINEIKQSLKIESPDLMNELVISYMQSRLRPLVNAKDFYSTSKGLYTAFENLSVEDLDKIIKRRDEDIMQREKSLLRFKKRKTEIDGQLTFIIDGATLTGYKEAAL